MRQHMLDNEWSEGINCFIYTSGDQHQQISPGLHRALISKRSIKTFKHHLIYGLSSCDPKSPLHLWSCLIRQALLTLNLLCPEILNSRLLAELFLNVSFDFNRTILAPPGTKVRIFQGRGWNRFHLYQFPICCPCANLPHWDGSPKNSHQYPNLQHHCGGIIQRHSQAENIKIHRHTLLLAPVTGDSGPI